MSEDEKTEAMATVFHMGNIGLKLPAFMEDDPEAWFSLIDGQFNLRGIKVDSTKFYHAVSALQDEPQKQVKDILKLPKQTPNRYEQLKWRLVDSYSLDEIDRSAQIMAWPPMAEDDRPSIYINGLLSMLGDISPDHPFFRATVLGKMPARLSKLLRATDDCTDIRNMANEANKIWAGRNHRDLGLNMVRNLILGHQVPKQKPKKTSLRDQPSVDGVCPYHAHNGSNAYRCKLRCKFAGTEKPKAPPAITYVSTEGLGNVMAGSQ